MLFAVGLILCLSLARMGVSLWEKRSPARTRLKLLGEFLEVSVVAVSAVFLIIRPFVAQAFYIPSASMRPTLRENDRILVNELSYRFGQPSRGDVVVFRAPHEALALEPLNQGDETDFVKRIVGLPSDVVEIHHGTVYVNGEAQSEPYCREQPYYEMGPYVVPQGKLFVMGDNRNHSNDSHRWGAVDQNRLVGRAVCILWPPSRCGSIP